jgi:lipid A 3-O-deacylase
MMSIRRSRSNLSIWAVALTGVLPVAVHAGDVGLQLGQYQSYRDATLTYDSGLLWTRDFTGNRLDIRLESSAGLARAPSGASSDRYLWHVGLAPAARYWITPQTGIEYVVGANLFSGVRLGDKNISTSFQFGNSIGLFHRLAASPWTFGLRITHYSNADIKKPNPGQNYVQLRASYAFD